MALKENEIRPDNLRDAQQIRFEADIRRLLAQKKDFAAVPCPACGSRESAPAWRKYELSYVTCARCETVYINPRPTPEILESYYATSENYAYWNQHIFPASEPARREKIFKPRAARALDICRRHKVFPGTMLEVGAGFGTFCEEMKVLGFFKEIIAVEPTPGLAETCRRRGLRVLESPIERVRLDRASVNVAASFEVIEHLFSPRDFIKGCLSVLAPGGLLILTCPNVKGFDIEILRELSDAVDVEHLNYFHPASLSRLVAECGMDVLEVSTPGELDAELVRKKILAGRFDASGQPFLKKVLIDEWDRLGGDFQKFLAEKGLSSHMWLVARKP